MVRRIDSLDAAKSRSKVGKPTLCPARLRGQQLVTAEERRNRLVGTLDRQRDVYAVTADARHNARNLTVSPLNPDSIAGLHRPLDQRVLLARIFRAGGVRGC